MVGRPKIYDETLRDRLIEEAEKMLSKDGYHGLSLRVITNAAGTSTNAVYTLFGSKEALMAEVVVRDLNRNLAPINDAVTVDDPEVALVQVLRLIREFALKEPNLFTGAFDAMVEARTDSSLTERLNPNIRNIDSMFYAPVLAACQRVAESKPDLALDPSNLAAALWASVHGFVLLEITGLLPELKETSEEVVFDEMIFSLYSGWAGREGIADQDKFDRK